MDKQRWRTVYYYGGYQIQINEQPAPEIPYRFGYRIADVNGNHVEKFGYFPVAARAVEEIDKHERV